MISLLGSGWYKLTETKGGTKILYLDDHAYAWIYAGGIRGILVASYKEHSQDALLALGQFRMYEVINEEGFSDRIHLELEAGRGTWQGYLLTSGLPDEHKKRVRIIPTKELISKEPLVNTSALPTAP